MKAISLLQPWASLIAVGAKKIETRSWSTNHRGPLAIHASLGTAELGRALTPPFRDFLEGLELPLGCVLCTCNLLAVERIDMFTEIPPDPEFQFGNYAPGRYMWKLAQVEPFELPIRARGALNLWDWHRGQ